MKLKTSVFRAHSKREELLELVSTLNPDKIVLIHGDNEAISWMGNSILKKISNKKVFAAENFYKIIFD
ncbi:MAG: hypothetical protein M5T52_14760 [Ignavibacteriaceae bacterium]|nr:hypothetical protein [Ignavibacteriaceae bacterium]